MDAGPLLRVVARVLAERRLEAVRRLLALPPEQRTNFLRVRVPFRGSAL